MLPLSHLRASAMWSVDLSSETTHLQGEVYHLTLETYHSRDGAILHRHHMTTIIPYIYNMLLYFMLFSSQQDTLSYFLILNTFFVSTLAGNIFWGCYDGSVFWQVYERWVKSLHSSWNSIPHIAEEACCIVP